MMWDENWWLNIHIPKTIPTVVKIALLDGVCCLKTKIHSRKQQVEDHSDSHSDAE